MHDKIKQAQNIIILYAKQLRDLRTVGLLLFLVIVLLVSWSGVKTIEANYGLQKQISALKQENTVKKLANENLKLQNEYLNTPQYLEVAARQDFGLAAPGETVLNVPRSVAMSFTVDPPKDQPAPDTKQNAKQTRYQQNFQAWLDFLFHRQQD